MTMLIERPTIQACSVHQVAKRQRVWSCQVYRKAMVLRDEIRVEEAACPHCMMAVRRAIRQQFPALYTGAPSEIERRISKGIAVLEKRTNEACCL